MKLSIYKTERGNWSVRPSEWEVQYDFFGRIKEAGYNHLGIFAYKKDAEKFVGWMTKEDEGLLITLPCRPGTYVYKIFDQKEYSDNIEYPVIMAVPFCIKDLDEVGKTIFLSVEEAADAIENIKENKRKDKKIEWM